MDNVYQGKKLLLLAGQGVHQKVVEACRANGIYTVVADYLPDSPAKRIADETSMLSIMDVEGIVEYCRKNDIDGVMNFCNDLASKVIQVVNEQLGLPNIGTKEQVATLTNKQIFKHFCKENNIDTIPEYSMEDVEAGNIEYPVLVKPVDSRGSRGSAICYDKEELLKAIPVSKAAASDGESIIIEKFLGKNQDLSIVYYVIDGEPYLVQLGDRYQGRMEDGLERQICGIVHPSRYTDMYLRNVNDRMIAMIKKLGIVNAPVFVQGFVDGDTVRMYDPGIRFPGNEFERIFAKATGLNLMLSSAVYFLTGKMPEEKDAYKSSYDLNGLCAVSYMVNARAGTITTYKGLDVIRNHPGIVDVQEKRSVGEVIENTGDVLHRIGEISILCERSSETLRSIIHFIHENLIVEDENGQSMLISPLDDEIVDLYKDIF